LCTEDCWWSRILFIIHISGLIFIYYHPNNIYLQKWNEPKYLIFAKQKRVVSAVKMLCVLWFQAYVLRVIWRCYRYLSLQSLLDDTNKVVLSASDLTALGPDLQLSSTSSVASATLNTLGQLNPLSKNSRMTRFKKHRSMRKVD